MVYTAAHTLVPSVSNIQFIPQVKPFFSSQHFVLRKISIEVATDHLLDDFCMGDARSAFSTAHKIIVYPFVHLKHRQIIILG